MEDFLRSSSAAAKTSFRANQRVHVVLGSESCDLDSVVSSLAMAYFLSRTSSRLPGRPLVLPVLNLPRSELQLCADVLLLLREAGVDTETLVCRDEVELARLHGDRRLALTLVDQDVLPSTDSVLQGAVVEVIGCPVTVETVASCATLVTERIVSRAPEILDRQLALLLYGVLVVDSVLRGTVRDSQMIHLLQTQFPDLPHRGALHAALQTAAEEDLLHVYSVSRHHRRWLQLGAEDYGTAEEDSCGRTTPPAPGNSLVDGCPLDGDRGFNQEALLEKFSRMGGASR